MKTKITLLCGMAIAFIVSSCASQRPVLYPDAYLMDVGEETAQQDVDACIRLAYDHGAAEQQGGKVARDTAESAVVGGATGAVVGAVIGSGSKGAAAGAAGGGVATLTRGLFRSREADPLFRSFVDRCLRERGYTPIGWR